jgi:hypothetical protein
VQQYPSNNPEIGCWASDGDSNLITGVDKKHWEQWRANVVGILERNCTIDYISTLIIALNQVCLRDINIILNLDRAVTLAQNPEGSDALVRNHAFSRALKRVHQCSRDLARITAAQINRCEELVRELENLWLFDTEFHLNHLRDLAQETDRQLDFDRNLSAELNLVREMNLPRNRLKLAQTLNVIHELTAIRNRCIINARSLSRIFAQDLARPITLSIFQICDLDFVLSHTLNVRLDIVTKLDREIEAVLLHSRQLNYPQIRDIEVLFELSRHIGKNLDFSGFRCHLLLISSCWHWIASIYQKAATNPDNFSGKYSHEKSYESLGQEYEAQKAAVLNLYVCSVLLRERKLGKIPAWEGIRLVRYCD